MISQSIVQILLITIFNSINVQSCVHDQMAANVTFHYYDDVGHTHTHTRAQIHSNGIRMAKGRHWYSGAEHGHGRLLQTTSSQTSTTITTTTTTTDAMTTVTVDSMTASSTTLVSRKPLRIYADYTLLTGDIASQNVIKRVVNISANFYYNTLKVDRLSKLFFPSGIPLQCNILAVPPKYATTGVIGDLGILVSNEDNNETYVARSTSCTLMKSNNRPIWGVVIFNNRNLGYGQIQFQKVVSVAVHELAHVLGFSSALYPLYPTGNPFIIVNDVQYLKTPKLLAQIQAHFNCSTPIGLPLQDQDGTINSSHQQRKVLGNEFMIAISKKQAFISRFTLALLDSTGWYDVSYAYAEPTGWGKNKGCNFLNIDICSTEEFCSKPATSASLELNCDWDGTAYGSCINDPFAGSCNIVNYYTNTICLDQSYQFISLTQSMKAKQKGGSTSRCYNSTFRATGIAPNIINYRCYATICSTTGSVLYVKLDTFILLCRTAGQEVLAPSGMEGVLRCPNYRNYCLENKKTCAFHCNKNGICINGMCLCTGANVLTSTCLDQSNLTTTITSTGGLTNSIIVDSGDGLSLINRGRIHSRNVRQSAPPHSPPKRQTVTSTLRSINIKCIQGTFLDRQFGECVRCRDRFGCDACTENGCMGCVGSCSTK